MDLLQTLQTCLRAVLPRQPGLPANATADTLAKAFLDASEGPAANARHFAHSLNLDVDELQVLRDELRRFVAAGAGQQGDAASSHRRRFSILRALYWFETARDRNCKLALPAAEPVAVRDVASMFERVYAVELVFEASTMRRSATTYKLSGRTLRRCWERRR